MKRRYTKVIKVGNVQIGGDAPIVVQSMTNTDTRDSKATIEQINGLAKVGCEIIRVAVPDEEASEALKLITKESPIPVIADIHFDYRLAIKAIENGIHGLRLNPGNIGSMDKVQKVVERAKYSNIPIRIGVNAGSLEKHLLEKYKHATPEAMVESALSHIKILENLKYDQIKVSLKASNIPLMLEAYQLLAKEVDYPLHIGVTEAGTIRSGTIKSAVGIGALLAQGIGDTLRVSLTGDPLHEIPVAFEILKALGLRERGPIIISCPTCGRTEIGLIDIAEEVENRLQFISQPLKVAIMGCVVNGPGEAREADIGIAGGKGVGLIFKKGEIFKKVREENLIEELFIEINNMIEEDQQG